MLVQNSSCVWLVFAIFYRPFLVNLFVSLDVSLVYTAYN